MQKRGGGGRSPADASHCETTYNIEWNRHGMSSVQQDEGEALARKNGELEAALRRTRAACRESDAEADRLAGRAEALEAQVGCVSGCVRCFRVLGRLVYGT